MMEGPGADSEEKRVLASDLDTVTVDSLKALDLSRPIREADISGRGLLLRKMPSAHSAGLLSLL
jgi:hypothetical protein